MFICLRPRTPYPPPFLYTVYVYAVYLFTQVRGGGGGELNQREGERGKQQRRVQIIKLG